MIRELRRQRKIEAKKLLKLPPGKFKPIDLKKINHPNFITRAFKNNRYVVMISDNHPTSKGFAIRAMIQNHFDQPIKNHWSEIQKIKNEIFGKETKAIEFYPKDSELVDAHNIYWIWVFPDGTLPEIRPFY